MFINYIKIAFRTLRKHKFYTLINIFGLSLGIACSIILFQFISYHLSFDTYHAKAKNIYRVVNDLHLPDGIIEYNPGASIAMATALKMEVPQIKDQALLLNKRSFIVSIPGNNPENKLFSEKENAAFTDKSWFQLFDYTWEKGNQNTSLAEPNSAVLTRKLANKYFGTSDPIGRVIHLDKKIKLR